ncbi:MULTISPECIES: PTS sugar transporter subunit IIB [Enterococcus]|uniref:PTS system, ascorbate-specific IIB component n=1 Tax=Candidatus Enterococcus ferrettii TaxID=2815324 RepID=A0ABV0ERT8_9ENTE|nr:PTS sugar transporter subunit IIB [Enterococcus sp. 665A]MBO1341212.1 PTS sugar transporter subunit IIB [Enterococcus sp. 665A]
MTKKILIVCGNGLGSSFMVEMNIKKVLAEMGLEMEVSHTDLTSAKGEVADLYIGDKSIVENLEDGKKNIQGLVNLMSKKDLQAAIEKGFDL